MLFLLKHAQKSTTYTITTTTTATIRATTATATSTAIHKADTIQENNVQNVYVIQKYIS